MKLRIDVSPLKEIIEPGDSVPGWYGIAYVEEPWGNAVCYPLGLHLLVRWSLLLYHAIQLPRRAWWEKRLMDVSDLAYDRGVVIGKSMGTNIDGKQVFSKSQLNRHIAVAVDKSKAIERIPNDEAYGRGYHAGWATALDKIEELAGMSSAERRKLLVEECGAVQEKTKRQERQEA